MVIFQFSMWDSPDPATGARYVIQISFNSLCEIPSGNWVGLAGATVTFNSLCEIRVSRINKSRRGNYLSILYVRFKGLANRTVTIYYNLSILYVRFTAQVKCWWCKQGVLSILYVRFVKVGEPVTFTARLTFNSLCEILPPRILWALWTHLLSILYVRFLNP